ncbi:MAG TPA: septum formation initiator family protein [Cryomorphaceae bacterium]|nr:septum formation initiator family protein [Cryomorphaceae bacterium]
MKLPLGVSRKLPAILRNKYSLVIILFLVYITFFDAHDLISQLKIKWDLHEIETQIEYLEEDTRASKAQIEELTTNQESLEKFAREQYRMKRENEEIFVIIKE